VRWAGATDDFGEELKANAVILKTNAVIGEAYEKAAAEGDTSVCLAWAREAADLITGIVRSAEPVEAIVSLAEMPLAKAVAHKTGPDG